MAQVLFEFQVSKIKLRLQKLIWSQQRPSIMQRRFTIRPGPRQNVCYPSHRFQYHNLWKGKGPYLYYVKGILRLFRTTHPLCKEIFIRKSKRKWPFFGHPPHDRNTKMVPYMKYTYIAWVFSIIDVTSFDDTTKM